MTIRQTLLLVCTLGSYRKHSTRVNHCTNYDATSSFRSKWKKPQKLVDADLIVLIFRRITEIPF